jgi:ribosomal subunit interface protein
MDVTITARHCAIPAATRETAIERIRRLTRFEPRAATALVRFERERGAHQVETVVSVPGGQSLIARATGASFRAALEQAAARIERQMRRQRQRARQFRAVSREAFTAPLTE